MRVDEFDFLLPESHIALRPISPRDSARMLVVKPGEGEPRHAIMGDLPEYLRPGDCLVLNDTKVICARLNGRRLARASGGAGAKVEITLIRRDGADRFKALAKPAKRLALGDALVLGENLSARVAALAGAGEVLLRFDLAGTALDEAIAAQGAMPLPPYIAGKRKPDEADRADYQTLFAAHAGAVAAPTAGLHFTEALFAKLEARGVKRAFVTLHVGAGTFLPVGAADTADHKMHAEWAHLDAETAERLNKVRADGGRIVAVGTTALRSLESAADAEGCLRAFEGDTDIFITPGYRFRAVDMLLTNFHLPRSTLFMLVAAFSGLQTMKAAYAEAIAQGYRFYSYGDACLLFKDM